MLVYNRQFLNPILLQQTCSLCKVRTCSGHQVLACHNLAYRSLLVGHETEVSVGDNSYEFVPVVHHRNSTNVVVCHKSQCISYQGVRRYCYRVEYHSVLGSLHTAYLVCLNLYRHVLVDDSYAALARNGNRHPVICNGVHGR